MEKDVRDSFERIENAVEEALEEFHVVRVLINEPQPEHPSFMRGLLRCLAKVVISPRF